MIFIIFVLLLAPSINTSRKLRLRFIRIPTSCKHFRLSAILLVILIAITNSITADLQTRNMEKSITLFRKNHYGESYLFLAFAFDRKLTGLVKFLPDARLRGKTRRGTATIPNVIFLPMASCGM